MRLTAAPGAGRRPSPPRRFSLCLCPFLLRSAACPTLAHSAARSGRLDAPHPQGFLDTWRLGPLPQLPPGQPCPGSPLSSSSPFPQQGQPHPQPHWPHLGLPQLEPSRNRGHCQSPTAPQPLPCTCPQPGALHPGAANTARGTEEAGEVSSLRHIGNPGSALATRLSAQRQQDRGRKGKRKAGGRTEGGGGLGQGAGKRDAANQRGTGSRTRG